MNARDVVLVYTDSSAEPFLRSLAQYGQIGSNLYRLASTSRYPIPGLPHVVCDPKDFGPLKAPWGVVQMMDPHYAFTNLNYLLHVTRSLKPGASLPEATLPQPGIAVLDAVTREVAVYAGVPAQGTVPTRVEQAPVWEGRLTQKDLGETPLITPRAQSAVLRAVREGLACAGVPVFPAQLYGRRADPGYPWIDARGLPLPPAHVANDEVSVPLLGYALDDDTQTVVYLSMVAHKTACRSIWGSLNTAHKRRLNFEQPGGEGGCGYSSHNYATYSTPVDPDTGLTRLQIIDRRAMGQESLDVAYLVIPKGMAEADMYEAFAVRLNAVLPIGILPAWGEQLRWAGDEAGLVKKLYAVGDVAAVYKIAPDPLWHTLVEELLKSGELVIR